MTAVDGTNRGTEPGEPARPRAGGPALAALRAPLGFGVAVAVLLLAGRGDLAAPPIAGFGEWLEARGPVTATMALGRLVALAAAVWMLVVASVAAVARGVGATRLAVAAERAVPPGLRRVLTGLAGAGAAGAVLVGVGRGPIGAVTTGRDAAAQPPVTSDDTVTMSVLPPDPATSSTTTSAGADPSEPADAAAGTDETWTVEPGDSFWSIATELLADATGHEPTDVEVAPYWRLLIDANRDRLVSGDPDLIVPGQELIVLPATPR